MRVSHKLKSVSYFMALLFLIFYIVSVMIPAKHPEMKEESGAEQLSGVFPVQNIPECQCSRKWMYPPTFHLNGRTQSIITLKRLNSTCSDEGTYYQTNQNVITFSMYFPQNQTNHTSNQFYQIGLFQNLLKMREHYPPGYSLRVYTSVTLQPGDYLCDLLCNNTDIFWCDIRKTPVYGDLSGMNFRTWRLLTLGDPTVHIFHSRDLDSLISHREAATVSDWLSGSVKGHKAIMAMRDRKNGHNFAMLAGMWGADNTKLLGKGEKLQKRLFFMSQLSSAQEKTFDQQFLSTFVFYPMAKDILAYDSYTCVEWSNFTEVRPFPVKRGDPQTDFVGNRFNFTIGQRKPYAIVECPKECRPSYGLDWIYC